MGPFFLKRYFPIEFGQVFHGYAQIALISRSVQYQSESRQVATLREEVNNLEAELSVELLKKAECLADAAEDVQRSCF